MVGDGAGRRDGAGFAERPGAARGGDPAARWLLRGRLCKPWPEDGELRGMASERSGLRAAQCSPASCWPNASEAYARGRFCGSLRRAKYWTRRAYHRGQRPPRHEPARDQPCHNHDPQPGVPSEGPLRAVIFLVNSMRTYCEQRTKHVHWFPQPSTRCFIPRRAQWEGTG